MMPQRSLQRIQRSQHIRRRMAHRAEAHPLSIVAPENGGLRVRIARAIQGDSEMRGFIHSASLA